MSKLNTYTVHAWLTVLCSTSIKATSFEEAAAEAQTLKESDFIDFHGEFADGRAIEISWISADKAGPA